MDSVERRRRLLRPLTNLIIVTLLAAIGWRYFLHPLLKRTFGTPAPAITAPTLQGRPFSISAEREHMVVLDFFATWCEPCRQSLPFIERFAAEHPDVAVVLVDEGEPARLVAPFAQQYKLSSVVLDENFAVGRAYNVNGFPVTVAIDGRGLIRNTYWGYSPQIGAYLLAAKLRYEAERRAKNAATPARPS